MVPNSQQGICSYCWKGTRSGRKIYRMEENETVCCNYMKELAEPSRKQPPVSEPYETAQAN
eukprot:scaffold11589_cov117-Cylindrotheca_fusiformis.AAC.7